MDVLYLPTDETNEMLPKNWFVLLAIYGRRRAERCDRPILKQKSASNDNENDRNDNKCNKFQL